jgi:SAM-dependent methyltransferase
MRLLSLALVAALIVFAGLFAFHASREPAEGAGPAAKANPDYRQRCNQFKPSPLATKYLEKLHGIEIGASTQNSFGLKRSINVDFSDEQGGLWQDKACAPAVVNIVALGDDLPFKDGTLDYVLSSHVIEHFFDPIRALREWYRVIRPGGYIFIIAPHKDRTFDKPREVTPLKELIDRSTGRLKLSNYARPPDPKAPEPQKLVRSGAGLETGWTHYEADDHHHWSVWRTDDFVELVRYLRFNIVEVQDVDDKVGNGFTVVIRK